MSEPKAAFTPPSLFLATLALSLATFMQVLDSTIANVALPTISGNLGVSADQGTWVITSFAVCNAIALPLTGWFTRRFGQLRLFIASVMFFTLTSFLCGFAHSMTELIIFRALQGFFAGPMFPMCQTLLLVIFPPMKRSMALALLSMVTVVAPIVGPITGGWLTDNYSGRGSSTSTCRLGFSPPSWSGRSCACVKKQRSHRLSTILASRCWCLAWACCRWCWIRATTKTGSLLRPLS